MKFTIVRKDFLKALNKLKPLVPTGAYGPAEYLRVAATDNGIILTANSMDNSPVFGQVIAPGTVIETGEAFISYKKFQNLVNKSKKDEFEIEVTSTEESHTETRTSYEWNEEKNIHEDVEREIVIEEKYFTFFLRSGKTEIKVREDKKDIEFPEAPKRPRPAFKTEFTKNVYDKVFTALLISVETCDLRPAMKGVLFHVDTFNEAPRFRIVSTDGHRLMAITPDASTQNIPESTKYILPSLPLDLAKKEKTDVTIYLPKEYEEQSKGTVVIEVGDLTLTAPLIEERYPNWEGVIPCPQGSVSVKNSEMLEALGTVSLTANPVTNQVVVDTKEKTISSEDVDLQTSSTESMSFETDFHIRIGFNVNYLIQMFNVIPEEVEMEFSGTGRAVLFNSEEDGVKYMGLVMPLKLNN